MDQLGALRQWIGHEWGPVKAPGPIEWSDVRRYLNAVGGQRPAEATLSTPTSPDGSQTPVPPAMILDVLRPAPGMDTQGEEESVPSSGGPVALIKIPGERLRLNVSTEIEWTRPPRIGDWVSVKFKIVEITMKERRDGPAVYITEERRYADQAGKPIALVRQTTARLLKDDATASGPGRSRVESSPDE